MNEMSTVGTVMIVSDGPCSRIKATVALWLTTPGLPIRVAWRLSIDYLEIAGSRSRSSEA